MMGYSPDPTLIQERIKARYQTSFWKDFVDYFSKFGSETYKLEQLKKFEFVFITLIDQIVLLLEINPDETFEQLNYVDSADEMFDEFFKTKRDLGSVFRDITKLIGLDKVAAILNDKL